MLVAITGGTSSGKTTLARAVSAELADVPHLVLSQDTYFSDLSHLPEDQREAARTANRPEAVNWDALVPQLEALKRGVGITHPVPGTRAHARGDAPSSLGPVDVALVEGHLLLTEERVRDLADLKVFVECDVEVRVLRRITRDTGRAPENPEALQRSLAWYWRDVLPNNQRYTTLQRGYADLIIPHDKPNPLAAPLLAACIRHLLAG
ncbi:MAG TPA: uridine kinase [Chloroflexota bacterium]|nr:uridine kinase [Chloroflexota bacterium]